MSSCFLTNEPNELMIDFLKVLSEIKINQLVIEGIGKYKKNI
jgi:hypothetical protein